MLQSLIFSHFHNAKCWVGFSTFAHWLEALLREKFFNACPMHETTRKNEKNIFCLDYYTSICPHCLSLHRSPRLLQIRRYVCHDVIRLDNLEKLIDCNFVQSYMTNKAKVVFLNHRPQSRPFRGSGSNCYSCERSLQDLYIFCSLFCKGQHLVREEGGLSKYLCDCESYHCRKERKQSAPFGCDAGSTLLCSIFSHFHKLEALLREFFNACLMHKTVRKNEKNIFCLDCYTSIYPRCLSLHRSHRLFQIRRYVYHDVIRLDDLEKLINCNFIQKPSWEKAAKIIRERYDPEMDGRIILAKVDCTEEGDLCRRNHIQGYPSIRIFRKGSDIRDNHGHHDHESYYGERDTDSLVTAMETLVAPVPMELHKHASENNSTDTANTAKRPAPLAGGCRIEGFVRVKKVPGNLVISAHSGEHSFDASLINVSHVISHFSFGRQLTPKLLTEVKRLTPYLGENVDQLTGRAYITKHGDANANVTIEHYLQIVKTEVISRRHSPIDKLLEYEYTAHSSLAHSPNIPVAKFHFVPSAMQVLVTENQKSFSHFITNICAIIGGVFTVAGILDSILHNTIRLVKKIELGKQF